MLKTKKKHEKSVLLEKYEYKYERILFRHPDIYDFLKPTGNDWQPVSHGETPFGPTVLLCKRVNPVRTLSRRCG